MKKINILEVGCGQGFHVSQLANNPQNKVVGVDMSRVDISIAKNRYPHLKFEYMNAERLKFASETFDKVYALDVLEHVDNLEKVVKEVSRVMRKGGHFYINVPAEKSEQFLLKIRPTYFKEIHHVRIFKSGEMEKLLKKYRLKLKKKEHRGFLQHIELLYLFTRKSHSNTQLSIGDWRRNWISKGIHVAVLYFHPAILNTPMKYFPLWVLTLPVGNIVNLLGNQLFPKSIYYKFRKV